ncbi:hypothetical protein BOTCAL_0324g00010 [Botryotinia calthae]|uniref:Uncharacterized protein n=1 Tax=Botryotinia calthae TaxID=38488 RepID=A0A4Y8CTI2_9HELO|nr:hypothetical protein BOTCAL_0324g00010 [Botryotinia calthae]
MGFVPRQTDGVDLQCGRVALAIPLSLFMQHDADELNGKNGAIKVQETSELLLTEKAQMLCYMQNKAGPGRLARFYDPASTDPIVEQLLGLVTSQHPSANGSSVPAAAMIVASNADDTSPVVWVHNNGLGSGEESNGAIQQIGHWQGLGTLNDLSGPMEVKRWGLVRPV